MAEDTFDEILGEPLMHDHVVEDISDIVANYLKLDQTTPQKVINGIPTFGEGIKVTAGKKVIYDGS